MLLWQLDSPFVWWAIVSVLLGLGYTFFSGATEAWLVDALTATKFDGMLEAVFARGQVVGGVFMLLGSVAGGYIAQLTNLGVPYVVRAAILVVMFVIALVLMRDLGFTPERGKTVGAEIKTIVSNSVQYGLKVPAIRATMLSGFFLGGIGVYVFYALQPYLLQLWGDPEAYGIAGLVAAIVAGATIVGGLITPLIRRWFARRTSVLILMTALGVALMAGVGLAANFWLVLVLIVLVQPGRRRGRAGPPRVPERDDPVPAAGDDPVLRLVGQQCRRHRRPAGPGPGRRRLQLPDLLPVGGHRLGAGPAVPDPGAGGQRPRRPGDDDTDRGPFDRLRTRTLSHAGRCVTPRAAAARCSCSDGWPAGSAAPLRSGSSAAGNATASDEQLATMINS